MGVIVNNALESIYVAGQGRGGGILLIVLSQDLDAEPSK
jgi:hypothetical protein